MPENETIRFTAKYTHDWNTEREFQSAYHSTRTSYILLNIVLIVLVPLSLRICWWEPDSTASWAFLFLGVLMCILEGKNHLPKNQKTLPYKQALFQNGGTPPTIRLSLSDSGFTAVNQNGATPVCREYNLVERILESKHFLILMLPCRLCVLIRKDSISGGSKDELVDYLRQRCPNLKSRKVRTPTLGRVLHILALTLVILGVLLLQFRKIGVL